MKLFRKLNLNDHINSGSAVPDDVMSPLGRPTQTDITRYRYHNGTNLGSIYVLEKWIFPKMFSNPPVMAKDIGAREIDAVQASIKAVGLEATKKRWELHWQKAVLPADWTWLRDVARCTSIRLPIGYYTLSQEFCKGTPFEGDVWEIYTNAWQSVKTLVKTASAHGIGVLLDLHALPGGANKDAHSGSGTASLWTNESNRIMARRCAVFLAQEVARDEEFAKGVIGIQLVNEAKWKAERMYDWYDSVIDSISKIQPDLPIYISDAWDLPLAVNYAQKKNTTGIQNCRKKGPVNPVVVDTHKYYCFNETHKAMHPLEVISNKVPSDFGNVVLSGPTSIVVGEWSCVLSETAWGKVSKDERVTMTSSFGQQQSLRWYEKTGGSYFWTWKLGWMPGGSWGFSKQINEGNLVIPPGLQLSRHDIVARIASAQNSRPTSLSAACKSYLDRHSDAEGYTNGWNQGFEDSIAFFDSGGHVIGLFGAWVMKRMTDAGGGRPQSWIDGFERGVGDFRKLAVV